MICVGHPLKEVQRSDVSWGNWGFGMYNEEGRSIKEDFQAFKDKQLPVHALDMKSACRHLRSTLENELNK